MSMTKLSERERIMLEEYVMNGRKPKPAALEAGYSENTAHVASYNIIKRPAMQKVINELEQRIDQELAEKLFITVADKAEILSRILYDVVPRDPNQPVLRQYYREAMKALQELNKMQGHYAPDRSVKLTVDATKQSISEVKKVYEDY